MADNTRNKRFPLLLNETEHKAYTKLAEDLGISLGALIRKLLDQKLRQKAA